MSSSTKHGRVLQIGDTKSKPRRERFNQELEESVKDGLKSFDNQRVLSKSLLNDNSQFDSRSQISGRNSLYSKITKTSNKTMSKKDLQKFF